MDRTVTSPAVQRRPQDVLDAAASEPTMPGSGKEEHTHGDPKAVAEPSPDPRRVSTPP